VLEWVQIPQNKGNFPVALPHIYCYFLAVHAPHACVLYS